MAFPISPFGDPLFGCMSHARAEEEDRKSEVQTTVATKQQLPHQNVEQLCSFFL